MKIALIVLALHVAQSPEHLSTPAQRQAGVDRWGGVAGAGGVGVDKGCAQPVGGGGGAVSRGRAKLAEARRPARASIVPAGSAAKRLPERAEPAAAAPPARALAVVDDATTRGRVRHKWKRST